MASALARRLTGQARWLWSSVKPVPPDPILGLVARFKKVRVTLRVRR